ncbi:ABC transporter permease [Treponema sp.]|uniref:ABC transporter permease n=1 Tax=Treponema sp. TaxID=166 RepID=UPI0025E89043|nr:ABC transporter permease [Treponema sp.]MCR5217594.1 ABC transporter permease [Treponema sp.]
MTEKLAKAARDYKYKKQNPGPLYSWPMGIWFSIFFIVPILIIICYSFMKNDLYGGVIKEFTLDAYKQMFSPEYGEVFLRTLWMTVVATFISCAIAIPCGYAMARSRHQTLLLILVIIPFLTNSLIRIFAWMTILGEEGLLNTVWGFLAKAFFFVSQNSDGSFEPVQFMYTKFAVILVSIYMYLPYAILPIFTSIDRFDFTLLEAARDLGASKPGAIFRVMLPGIKSGIISALIFTFIPIFGNYTVPQIIGSTESYMLGNTIMDQITKIGNLPLAAAISVVLTFISMAAILFMISSEKKEQKLKNVKKES